LESELNLFSSSVTLAQRIDITGGKATGFDYLRIGLAIFIVAFHSVATSSGSEAQSHLNGTLFRMISYNLLPMFFALSGFLVAGSLERAKSLFVFLGLRVLRIYPALIVDTLVCALLIGPLLTVLPLKEYFADTRFWQYLLNSLGWIHYYLPGVFDNNPMKQVNLQLWTIPSELECYVAITLLAAIGLHRQRRWFLIGVLLALVILEILMLLSGSDYDMGQRLVMCFLVGVTYYLYKDKIPWRLDFFVVALVLTMAFELSPKLGYLAPLTAAYVTIYLGLTNPRKMKFLQTGDYSYGVFLYGWPIQQILVATVPYAKIWWANILMAVPISIGFAIISWHFFEKRALAKKHKLLDLDRWVRGRLSPSTSS
jgi:peptidoglycan/LPS O-acetylase OafA/YrhL